VEIQTYQPKPDPPKNRPWYAIFMPDRVYLQEVVCDVADVAWQLRGQESGIFGTRLLITPYGRDFEYRASGGQLRTNGLTPEMKVDAIHLLITKVILKVYQFELTPRGGGSIKVSGEAGMRDDKHVDAGLEIDGAALAPWLPKEWQSGVQGRVSGSVRWKGAAQTLEASNVAGELKVSGGRLLDLPLLDYLAAAARRKSLEDLDLTRCDVKFQWKYPRFEASDIDVGSEAKFSVHGSAAVEQGALSGTLELGMAPEYLSWLPKAKEEIFTREEDGLLWTTVHLSGTVAKPETDLGPRLAQALKKDPAAATGLFFRGVGEWFEQKSRGR
jgi:hypothetical protein